MAPVRLGTELKETPDYLSYHAQPPSHHPTQPPAEPARVSDYLIIIRLAGVPSPPCELPAFFHNILRLGGCSAVSVQVSPVQIIQHIPPGPRAPVITHRQIKMKDDGPVGATRDLEWNFALN